MRKKVCVDSKQVEGMMSKDDKPGIGRSSFYIEMDIAFFNKTGWRVGKIMPVDALTEGVGERRGKSGI